jgi:hypothetical protein
MCTIEVCFEYGEILCRFDIDGSDTDYWINVENGDLNWFDDIIAGDADILCDDSANNYYEGYYYNPVNMIQRRNNEYWFIDRNGRTLLPSIGYIFDALKEMCKHADREYIYQKINPTYLSVTR